MPKYISQKEAFLKCKKEGKVIATAEIDIEKIKSTLLIAESDVEAGKILENNLKKGTSQWNSVYKLYYDAMHELTEAFLRFDNIKTDNHQCLFAYLCEKHPELEFSWDFFEKVRTKRNGINYYGIPVTYDDWKEIELQIILYINKLREEIRKKLGKQL
jgi:hypothetical protein